MKVAMRRPVRCRELLRELSQYLDGDLTAMRRRIVERHINACTCCGTMAARLRRTVAACRAGGTSRPPKAVLSRAADRVATLLAGEPAPPDAGQHRRNRQSSSRRTSATRRAR